VHRLLIVHRLPLLFAQNASDFRLNSCGVGSRSGDPPRAHWVKSLTLPQLYQREKTDLLS
jgi:hypothetical protein